MGKQHRRGALEHVPRQGQRGRLLAAEAQDIGSTRVARALAAGIREIQEAADDDCRGERAQQITEHDEYDA